MVSSPPGSPPSRRGNNQQQQGGQLLQELEALSQALYQAQRRGWPAQQSLQSQAPQAQALGQAQAQAPSPSPSPTQAPKKHSFLSRRETVPARRFSSHDRKTDVSPRKEPVPLPGLASRDSPTAFSNLLSRKSVSSPSNSKPRVSSSAIPPQTSSAWNDEKSDVRSRVDRRLSLQTSQVRTSDSYVPEDSEWSEDLSRKPDSSAADKKKSIWNWKPLRALSHIGRQRFHCVFSSYVHAIEGLPPAMNGLRLCVHMRKEETKEGAVQTMPSRVFQGIAEFQETLFMKCTLYGNKAQSSALKFMPKAFIVSVIAPDAEELDFGRHQLDLSRLLADSLDEKKGEPQKGSSWDTTLDLTGKAKGGKLVVTFSYEILDKDSGTSGNSSSRFKESPPHRSSVRTAYSLPNSAHGTPRTMTARARVNHSPSISEPTNDYEDLLAMEHLNLDEPSPFAGANEVRGQQATVVQGFPAFRSQLDRTSTPHNAFNAFPNFEAKSKSFEEDEGLTSPTAKQAAETLDIGIDLKEAEPASEEDDASSEAEAEFVVVDQGMEINKLAEKFQENAEVAGKTLDNEEKDDLDDLTPHLVEEYVEKRRELETDAEAEAEPMKETELESMKETELESMKEIDLEPMKETEVDGGEIDATNSVEVLENELAKSQDELSEVNTLNLQEVEKKEAVEKKETVTYQMVMRTLESLLQGTSAKEQPQEENLEERSESEEKLGESVLDKEKLGESVLDKEEVSAKEVMEKLLTQGMKQSDTIHTETVFDTQGMMAEFSKRKRVPQNLDNEVDLVAGEFLHLLESGSNPLGRSSDSEPDSPRARLLKQFEQEALLEGVFGPDLSFPEVPEFQLDDTSVDASADAHTDAHTLESTPKRFGAFPSLDKSSIWDSEDDKDLTSIMEAAESELHRATQSLRSRTRAKMLEDAETEALMQEWGLNEKAFVSSPPKHTFKQQEPPSLGKGLGSAVPLKDGGALRSMNPLHFQSNKTSGRLVMQVSKPVVVPAEMGSGTVDILRNMASMGVENMAVQAMTAMPLEDVTGMSAEQIAMEGMAATKSFRNRRALKGSSGGISLTKETSWNDTKFEVPSNDDNNGDFVSLEDLAPMAMQQIEALAVDGLKIQSDLSEEDAPYALNAFSVENQAGDDDMSRKTNIGTLKGVTGVHLLKGAKVPAETSGGGSGLMDMAITLDEWMLLDAGLYDETETKKDTLALMAAHHAVHQQLVAHGSEKEEKIRGGRQRSSKGSGFGCMGNTLTIAMLVQLRDPLRNNEAVGAPMMAFVQAERIFKPPKPKVGRTVSAKGNSEDEEADSQPEPQFKITGVHMAGLKTPQAPQDQKKIGWGSQKQQQTGSRWLIANGMSKNSKSHPLLKSNTTTTPSSGKVKVNKGESLWSISARVHGSGSKWKDIMKLNPHIRNPDVIYENQSLRTK